MMKTFETLRVLLATVTYCITSMFWAMAVTFIFMLVYSIFLCQTLHGSIMNESLGLDFRLWINSKHGTGSNVLYTVFFYGLQWLLASLRFACADGCEPMVFAMIRIISALFLNEIFAQALPDADMMVREGSKKTSTLRN